jgi:hypothetical protein
LNREKKKIISRDFSCISHSPNLPLREIVKERRLKQFVVDDAEGEYDETGEEV